MDETTLKGKKLEAYVLLKVLKYCTGSSVRSYQCKFVVKEAFKNKSIDSMEEVGAAIKEIIHYATIRGKFSSIHPDLEAEDITRVEVGEKGLHFFGGQQPGELPVSFFTIFSSFRFWGSGAILFYATFSKRG